MRPGLELHVRLIKADVRVLPDAEDLQVDAAVLLDQRVVAMTFSFEVLDHPVGQMRVVGLYVHLAKEVLVHEVVVALRIVRCHADVLVEVERRDLREIQPQTAVQRDEPPIHRQRRTSRRQPQHTVRLQIELPRHHIRRLPAHLAVRIRDDDAHSKVPFRLYLTTAELAAQPKEQERQLFDSPTVDIKVRKKYGACPWLQCE